jgi:hypothetical protein
MFSIKTHTGFIAVCLFAVAVAQANDYDQNDFAAEVIEYVQGSGVGYDWISLEFYNDPQTALGRPTLETTGDDLYIPESVSMPVVPVYPPFRAFEIVTIGNGGKLVIKFNHPVSDDENNPYGVDFIIFGNSRWRLTSSDTWGPESDPQTSTVGSVFYKEPGIVSVSQDGQNWYKFTTGPYADDFAPTAAYEWDDVNDVWGKELDPTRPVDPNLTTADFDGSSVAEIIEMYNGSAGGTGYDIGALGLDWIQYVRIEDDPTTSSETTEIDAIADVSCCGDYKHPYHAGDLNQDCRVDFIDFAILAQDWLVGSDWSDLAALAGSWQYCNWECE